MEVRVKVRIVSAATTVVVGDDGLVGVVVMALFKKGDRKPGKREKKKTSRIHSFIISRFWDRVRDR